MRVIPHLIGDRGESGQALVELALVMLVLMTLVFGALEIGRMVNAWAIVTQASREGARVGAARCTLDAGCEATVRASVENSLAGLSVADARWVMDGGPYQAGDPITVRVEFDVVPITPLIAVFVPGGAMTVVGETTMRLE
ncbi:MAG: pilus assembly protein [Dehalococcoidia bacterium]|nr:pilus assembly protein [Dehalococcoidia bacterium]